VFVVLQSVLLGLVGSAGLGMTVACLHLLNAKCSQCGCKPGPQKSPLAALDTSAGAVHRQTVPRYRQFSRFAPPTPSKSQGSSVWCYTYGGWLIPVCAAMCCAPAVSGFTMMTSRCLNTWPGLPSSWACGSLCRWGGGQDCSASCPGCLSSS